MAAASTGSSSRSLVWCRFLGPWLTGVIGIATAAAAVASPAAAAVTAATAAAAAPAAAAVWWQAYPLLGGPVSI